MKKFLSIGEVSKIKNVSAKSLRYYEKLGILVPAYTNPETGYRYYSVEQLLIVDLILICILLDIPLKNFKKYITSQGSIDIQQLLLDGQQIVNYRIQKLEKTSQFLSNISNHVMHTNSIKNLTGSFEEDFPDRYFLTVDYDGDLSDYRAVNVIYTQLFQQAMELQIPDNFNQGFFAIRQNEKIQKKIFLEIPKPHVGTANLYFLPGGKFTCKILPFEEFANINAQTKFFIVQELFDLKISPHKRLVEIQQPVEPNYK